MSLSKELAVLVGNGLSVAFNADLDLRRLTDEILTRLGREISEPEERAMRDIANLALPQGAVTEDDFERFVGAFGEESRRLDLLCTLAQVTPSSDVELQDAIKLVSGYTKRIRDMAVSHVLEVIFERSRMGMGDATGIESTIRAITEQFNGKIVFGNLNYDTILLATLLRVCSSGSLADMGFGFGKSELDLGGDTQVSMRPLRMSRADFPTENRVLLLHLHGSLTFWREPKGAMGKVLTDDLENESPWSRIREGATLARPVVILANQGEKSALAQEDPFRLAYSMFAHSIAEKRNWLIIGYSFKDSEVNRVFRDAFLSLPEKPAVLVVTRADMEATRRLVESVFGWGREDGTSDGWLTIDSDGALGLEARDPWTTFLASAT